MNTFNLIMFDLDGTLIESSLEICDAMNDTLRHFELTEVTQQQVNDWIGQGTRELVITALADRCNTDLSTIRTSDNLPAITAEFDKNYLIRCGTRSHLYPHVRETLVTLRERGIKLAVVTNKEGRFTTTLLNAHQLMPLFDLVVSGDSLSTKKPDPAGIESCLSLFDMPRHRALFVGDSSIDVATARNADVTVWALPYGYNMGQPIEASAPDRVISDFSLMLNI